MNRFAALIDRLATAAGDDMKHRLLADYLATTPEPDRTLAADILAAKLKPRRVKLALIRGFAEARLDPVLFALSLDYVGDVAETIALLWPPQRRANRDPSLSEVIEALSTLGRGELPRRIEAWLDACDASGRWALIKLVTGSLGPSMTARAPKEAQDEMFAVARAIAGTIDTLLMYVERGRSNSSPVTCTFGVWKDEAVLPIGKAKMTDDLDRLDAFVRDNTIDRFGPVRRVTHTRETGLVLEVAFEGLQRSPRHKSGIALRAPRIERVRWDKPPSQAAAIEALERLLPAL